MAGVPHTVVGIAAIVFITGVPRASPALSISKYNSKSLSTRASHVAGTQYHAAVLTLYWFLPLTTKEISAR